MFISYRSLSMTGEVALITFCLAFIFVTSKDVMSDPMRCHGTDKDRINPQFMDEHCLTQGTYVYDTARATRDWPGGLWEPQPFGKKGKREENEIQAGWVPRNYIMEEKVLITELFPGVASANGLPNFEDYKINIQRYRMTPVYLLLQGLMFMIPSFIWAKVEKGTIKRLVQDLHNPQTVHKKRLEQVRFCALQLKTMSNADSLHRWYHLLEVLNIFNVFFQFYITDRLSDMRMFYSYGVDVIIYYLNSDLSKSHPMDNAYPKKSMCRYFNVGPSGSVENFDVVCNLPLHSVIDQVYLFIWFFYQFLIAVIMLTHCSEHVETMYHLCRRKKKNSLPVSRILFLNIIRINVDQITFSKLIEELDKNKHHMRIDGLEKGVWDDGTEDDWQKPKAPQKTEKSFRSRQCAENVFFHIETMEETFPKPQHQRSEYNPFQNISEMV